MFDPASHVSRVSDLQGPRSEGEGKAQLVLSLFPGIGLLDRAFEDEGFCVVRGPDLLWGGDIRKFHPPAGRFDGVIGGPPCQAFSRLVHVVRANGHKVADNLIPEFERVILEAFPRWFLMENVEAAPTPEVYCYHVSSLLLNNRWVGGVQNRLRRFSWGVNVAEFGTAKTLDVELEALQPVEWAHAVTRDPRVQPVALVKGGGRKRPPGGGTMPHVGPRMSIARMLELQGLPADFFGDSPLNDTGKRHVLGNGVPLPMGRAIAGAVRKAIGGAEVATDAISSLAHQESSVLTDQQEGAERE